MVLEDEPFIIRQHFGSKVSFSEQLFSILSRVFEELTWISSWIWSFKNHDSIPLKKRQKAKPPNILEACILIKNKRFKKFLLCICLRPPKLQFLLVELN